MADPNTGVAVYYNGGWTVFGGTSSLNDVTADSSSTVKSGPSYLCNVVSR